MRFLPDLDDKEYDGKIAFVRVDFNVSMKNGHIGEDYRIRMSLPTIEYLTKRNCKVILASHLGRPKNRQNDYSLKPVAYRLSAILSKAQVSFVNDSIGEEVENKIKNLPCNGVLLLENLRFYKEEELNDPEFSKKLASLADIYINDAFSTSHRKHSSTYGAATLFNIKLGGFNLKKEIEYLTMIKENPIRPFKIVIGGVKIKDKIGALENLLPKADKVLIGGAAAYTFLKSKGYKIGNSLIDYDHLNWVDISLEKYGEKILLPTDHLVSSIQDNSPPIYCKENIPDGMSGFDIGKETMQNFSSQIGSTRKGTVFWNGPMGLFEKDDFSNGTINIAKSMALAYWRGSTTLVGGGDTMEGMKKAGVSEKEVSHVSTGGGATLRYLAGDRMPGLFILEQ
ncbi:MAG TPA: phosphoglycerate kinase [Nitrososphaeraceae archaeon]|nr:phosphoglycerate kinase [Nitrososphaeraceae archaeon]